MNPLITIGVTSFNSYETIDNALISALTQSWRPFEIIIVDDASFDGTKEKLSSYEKKHIEIKIFNNIENSGVAVSRNKILEEAKGEFVVFFDDDDISNPDRISDQYHRIIEYENNYAGSAPVICHTSRKIIYPHGRVRIAPTIGQNNSSYAPSGLAVARRILLGEPLRDAYGSCPTCSQMARLSTYRQVRGFDPAFRRSEDTDLNIRLAYLGAHFVGISKPLVTQVMTPTSEKSLAEEYKYLHLLLEKHKALMVEAGQYDFAMQWLDTKQAWLLGQSLNFFRKLATVFFNYPRLTIRRIVMSFPNIGINRDFIQFHKFRNTINKTSS